MVDRDGSVEYSKVISIANMGTSSIKVYPNYVSRGQTITIQTSSKGTTQADLLDASGRIVNTFKIIGRLTVSTDHMKRGMYLLKITDEHKAAFLSKVIVQ